MVVSEGAINNIMGGMENTAGVRLHSHRHKLKQRFDIIRKLGQGTYGKVQLAINKETGQEVAIKTIKKAKIETEQDLIRIRREIQIMSSVQHPQIIHIYEVFENREKMVLVMEYAAGGELYDYLSDRKVLAELEARRVFRQVASAVYYCHKHKICHRDLKLENILLDLDGNAKIADFGLSNVFDEKHRLDTFCGSPLYASPEIVKGVPYVGPEVDCWSLGVLLYTLVYGAMPFDGSNFRRLVKQITQGDFYEPPNPSNASELIRQMLTTESSERASVEDICNHWWVNEGYSTSCFNEAEALASQTPVRLDLLLSLAPKQIDSEHMLIQPDDEDIRQRELGMTPAPEEATGDSARSSPSRSAARSRSAGAVPPDSKNDIDLILEKKRLEAKLNEDKKSHDDEPTIAERKKKKDPSVTKKIPSDAAEKKRSAKKESKETDGEEKEKKKTLKKKDAIDTDFIDEKPERKTLRKRDTSNEREPKEEKKKVVKKRDSSLTRDKEKKKTVKKKESVKSDDATTEASNLKPPIPSSGPSSQQSSSENLRLSTKDECQEQEKTERFIPSPSPTPSTDTTLKTSDSSVQSRISEPLQTKGLSKVSPSTKPTVKSVEENEMSDMDTEKILQETAAKIERVEAAIAAESQEAAKNAENEKLSVSKETNDALSSAKSSKTSSRGTTPARSRTGSESSTEARPSRGEASSRRQSKIFSKAAMFDNMAATSPSPPEKTRKISRPGALNMSDLAKRFEEKPSVEKKTPSKVITPFKVSDARKAFENKSDSSQSESPLRKASIGSGGESLPTSPTRGSTPRSGSLSSSGSTPPSKSASATRNAMLDSPPSEPLKSPSKVSCVTKTAAEREKSPQKVLKSISKETPKKEKSPVSVISPVKKEKSPVKDKDKENVQPTATRDRIVQTKSTLKAKESLTKSKPHSVVIEDTQKRTPEVSKILEVVRTRQIPIRVDSSESSDSESEAEKLLKFLSEKREKLELAKAEKLKKVSEANREPIKVDMPAIKEESRTPTPARQIEKSQPPTPVPETPDTKFATLPRGFKSKPIQRPCLSTPRTSSLDEVKIAEPSRKKTEMEIVLNNQNAKAPGAPRRSSYTEIHIASPTTKESPRASEFRRETKRSVGTTEPSAAPTWPSTSGEPQLQRARRERIIPIMLEDDDEDDRSSTTTTTTNTSETRTSVSSSGRNINICSASALGPRGGRSSPESIRKSRRERIIPISVEGEGYVTPTVQDPSDGRRPFQKPLGSSSGFGRSRGFFVDRSESFSSAGEEEEEDEDDGFQILTAENLFSTLLSRVRSLTRKMTADDPRAERLRRMSPNLMNPDMGSFSGTPQDPSNHGFWSSLHTGDSPAKRISENFLRQSQSREDNDTFSNFASPLWSRSLSRDPSDADSVFSEPSAPFSTLPRGWRNRRSGAESVMSEPPEAMQNMSTTPRRHYYSRTLSREYERQRPKRTLLNTMSSMSRSGHSSNAQDLGRAAAVYDAIRPGPIQPLRRPHSVVERSSHSSSGEAHGRVGGQCEQQKFLAAPSASSAELYKPRQQTIPQQLRNLVRELENEPIAATSAAQNQTSSVTPTAPSSHQITNKASQVVSPISTSQTVSSIQIHVTQPKPAMSNSMVILKNKISDTPARSPDITKLINNPRESSPQSHRAMSPCSPPSMNVIQTQIEENKPKLKSRSSSVIINVNNKKSTIEKDTETNGTQRRIATALIEIEKSSPPIRVTIPKKINAKVAEQERSSAKSPTQINVKESVSEKKKYLQLEPYRRGKSEDLRSTIETLNSPHEQSSASSTLRPYRKSKTRDIPTTSDVASERANQATSVTLKKISPFEAYRRSKSRELGITIDQLTNSDHNVHRDATNERAKSPFERAKTSIERKVGRAKSPIERSMSPVAEARHKENKLKMDSNDRVQSIQSNDNVMSDRAATLAKEKVKDHEKPKSVYKLFTAKFSRSLSNVGEEPHQTDTGTKAKKDSADEISEKEDKFKLKRPSRFIKQKTEKSTSKTSINESIKEEEIEKRPVKRLSEALNKFLGRKTDEHVKTCKQEELKIHKNVNSQENSANVKTTNSKPLSSGQDSQDTKNGSCQYQSTRKTDTEDDVTLESATKNLCNHLSQIESNMTTRMDHIGNSIDELPQRTHELSPIPGNETVKAKTVHMNGYIPNDTTNASSLKSCHRRQLSYDFGDVRSCTPTESVSSSCLDDIRETEDESVIDRITRKSYYTRFNEKRKPALRRIDSRDSIDQQLAAAKARLFNEDKDERMTRESLSPTSSVRSQQTASPQIWKGVTRREQKKYSGPRTTSLPPEEGLKLYIPGPHSPQPGEYLTYHMQSPPKETVLNQRSPSIYPEERPVLSNGYYGLKEDQQWKDANENPFNNRMYSSAYNGVSEQSTSIPKTQASYRRLSPGIQDDIPMYHTLPHRKSVIYNGESSLPYNNIPSTYDRDSTSTGRRLSVSTQPENMNNNISIDHIRPETSVLQNGELKQAISDAGRAAGSAAAERASSREPSVPRVHSPELKSIPYSSSHTTQDARTLATAREELNKRLTPLTRLSANANDFKAKSYKRTHTTGRLGEGSTASARTPVAYKRTYTMDIPPTDSRARPCDFRKLLHEPIRRASSVRPQEELMPTVRTSSYTPTGQSLLRRTSFYRY